MNGNNVFQCQNSNCQEREGCSESKPHQHTKWCDVSGYFGQKTDVLCPKCVDITCKSCDGRGYTTENLIIDLLKEAQFEIAFDQKNGYPSYTAKDTLVKINTFLGAVG